MIKSHLLIYIQFEAKQQINYIPPQNIQFLHGHVLNNHLIDSLRTRH